VSENWWSTLASWFVSPVKAVAKPWWDQLVERKAEDAAVRLKLLEAVVGFRVSDFAKLKERNIDADKAVGIGKKIIDRLKPCVSSSLDLDVTSAAFLKQVENEIQLNGVVVTEWILLACLAEVKHFNPRQCVAVDYVNEAGGHSCASNVIVSLQQSFPFWHLFVSEAIGGGRTKLSPEAMAGLTEYVGRIELPEVRYQISEAMLGPGVQLVIDPLILPKGWKPAGSGST
jgi:hypothetical protein